MVMVRLIIPSIRVEVAKKLIREYGLSQTEVADRLKVTRAAVSQYLKGVRGEHEIKFLRKSKKVKKAVEKLVKELTKEEPETSLVLKNLCELCKTIRKEKLVCDYCKREMPELERIKCRLCC